MKEKIILKLAHWNRSAYKSNSQLKKNGSSMVNFVKLVRVILIFFTESKVNVSPGILNHIKVCLRTNAQTYTREPNETESEAD